MIKFLEGVSKVLGGIFTVFTIWLIFDQFRIGKKIENIFKNDADHQRF